VSLWFVYVPGFAKLVGAGGATKYGTYRSRIECAHAVCKPHLFMGVRVASAAAFCGMHVRVPCAPMADGHGHLRMHVHVHVRMCTCMWTCMCMASWVYSCTNLFEFALCQVSPLTQTLQTLAPYLSVGIMSNNVTTASLSCVYSFPPLLLHKWPRRAELQVVPVGM